MKILNIALLFLLSISLGFAQDSEQIQAVKKIGFERLSKAEYLKIMEKESYEFTKYSANNI